MSGPSAPDTIALRLQDVEAVGPCIKQFTFTAARDLQLPDFSGGSHIILSVRTDEFSFRNAYSLTGGPDRTASYQIAVLLAPESKGGSRFLHSLQAVGGEITASVPWNTFALVHTARHYVFIAGGIGITPFLTCIEDAEALGVSWELHYAVRSRSTAAFIDRLLTAYSDRVKIYASDEQSRLNTDYVLACQPLGTHLYLCGPSRLITTLSDAALKLGWPERCIHFEHFQSSAAHGATFLVELARSGKTVRIESGVSLLDGLEAAGVDVPYGCRGGACGACETVVLAGLPDHRDHYLSQVERESGKVIMPCVSRSHSERLVLDL